MKAPAPRGIGVAGEEGDTKSDPRIVNALRLPTQPSSIRLGEITTDIVVSLIAHRYDITRRRAGPVAELALGMRSSC